MRWGVRRFFSMPNCRLLVFLAVIATSSIGGASVRQEVQPELESLESWFKSSLETLSQSIRSLPGEADFGYCFNRLERSLPSSPQSVSIQLEYLESLRAKTADPFARVKLDLVKRKLEMEDPLESNLFVARTVGKWSNAENRFHELGPFDTRRYLKWNSEETLMESFEVGEVESSTVVSVSAWTSRDIADIGSFGEWSRMRNQAIAMVELCRFVHENGVGNMAEDSMGESISVALDLLTDDQASREEYLDLQFLKTRLAVPFSSALVNRIEMRAHRVGERLRVEISQLDLNGNPLSKTNAVFDLASKILFYRELNHRVFPLGQTQPRSLVDLKLSPFAIDLADQEISSFRAWMSQQEVIDNRAELDF